MGIPGFNTWFYEHNKQAYVPLQQVKVDHLYVDMNSLLHNVSPGQGMDSAAVATAVGLVGQQHMCLLPAALAISFFFVVTLNCSCRVCPASALCTPDTAGPQKW